MTLRRPHLIGTAAALACALAVFSGCSEDTKPDDPKPDDATIAADATDGGATDITDDDSATDAQDTPDTAVVDTKVPDTPDTAIAPDVPDDVQQDVPVDTPPPEDLGAPDVPPKDAGPECENASQCTAKVSPKACEQPACVDGKCALELKPQSCCLDTHCDDAKECTIDKCVQATNTCEHNQIPNCCTGKLTLNKAGFEVDWDGFIAKEGPTNGNVKWQPSEKRAHTGTKSLYFGNECGTYDNSQDPLDGCKSTGKASAVSTTLTTKSFNLPADKQTQLHFWLFLAAEPMYADSLPKGSCTPSCKNGASCVNINGTDQCLPEADVMRVKAIGSKSGTVTLFDSTTIGKSTTPPSKDGKPTAPQWQRVLVDLDKLKGETVQLVWTFDSGTGFSNNYEGIYLDGVVIETVCAVQGTICGPAAPCLDDANPCTSEGCSIYANTPGTGICFHDATAGCCTNADQCDDGQPCTTDTCNSGTCDNQPDTAKAGCCQPKVLYGDDFDSGVLSDWTLSSTSQLARWRIDPAGGTTKSQALYFGTSDFDSYEDETLPTGEGPKGSACAKTVTLQAGTVFNMVTFKLNMETEFSYLPPSKYKNPPLLGKPKYDYLSVTALQAGKSHELWTSDLIYGTTDGEWIDVTAPIPAKLQGMAVQICLNFQAGDDQVNDKEGVHIDTFIVRVTCEKKACYFDTQCAEQTCGACQASGCTATGCGCKTIPGCCALDKDCDDGKPCTADQCINKKCVNNEVKDCCTADSQCTASGACDKPLCDPTLHTCTTKKVDGCCAKDGDCQDFDPCTLPNCSTQTNTCSFSPVQGCCKQDSNCDDTDKCTSDNCIDGKCYYKPSGEPGC